MKVLYISSECWPITSTHYHFTSWWTNKEVVLAPKTDITMYVAM